jgi:hypothetical protein
MVVSIRKISREPLGIHALRAKAPDYCKVVLYTSLVNDARHRGVIFGGKKCLIVLYEGKIDGTMQGHYVCLSKRHNRIEYFSSMGFTPNHELTILGLKGKNPAFERLLGKAYEVNRKRLQMDKYDVNDCAYWTLARALLYKMSLREFQRFYLSKPRIQTSDDLLAATMWIAANS